MLIGLCRVCLCVRRSQNLLWLQTHRGVEMLDLDHGHGRGKGLCPSQQKWRSATSQGATSDHGCCFGAACLYRHPKGS